jgi:hypothetical protein
VITIHGVGDGTVAVDGIEIDGRVGHARYEARGPAVNDLGWHACLIALDDTAMHVMARYRHGTWLLGVGTASDDRPMPPWPLRILPTGIGAEHHIELTIDAPFGTRLA